MPIHRIAVVHRLALDDVERRARGDVVDRRQGLFLALRQAVAADVGVGVLERPAASSALSLNDCCELEGAATRAFAGAGAALVLLTRSIRTIG